MKSLCVLLLLGLASAAPAGDLVKSLPWAYPAPTFPIYSGFLTATPTRSLHYMVTASQSATAATDPVVLWLNGGPGCSSMDGLFYENGPYVFQEQSTSLLQNSYAWNQIANMVYFESPAGVGFSNYTNQSDLNQNDAQSAADNLAALVDLLTTKFPEWRSNPFYIAGESYGGIYVPYLAASIIEYNNGHPVPPFQINLKGFLVGNGVVNWNVDVGNALPYFAWTHDIIGTNTYNLWTQNNCNATNVVSNNCVMAQDEINVQMNNINLYDIYRDCVYNPIGRISKKATMYTPWTRLYGLKAEVPCVDDLGLHAYMNNATVRAALNIPTSWTDTWEICSDILDYTIDTYKGSYFLYSGSLLAAPNNLRVMIYSGDTDAAVPTNGTMTWLNMLGLANTTAWRQWSMDGQVTGYTIGFQQGLNFTTIKGTGHMSIQWKRPEGFYMFKQFLANEPL